MAQSWRRAQSITSAHGVSATLPRFPRPGPAPDREGGLFWSLHSSFAPPSPGHPVFEQSLWVSGVKEHWEGCDAGSSTPSEAHTLLGRAAYVTHVLLRREEPAGKRTGALQVLVGAGVTSPLGAPAPGPQEWE